METKRGPNSSGISGGKWYLAVLPIPDRDAVTGVGGDQPGVSGVELDLHHLVARWPERPEAEHVAAPAACGSGVLAGGERVWA